MTGTVFSRHAAAWVRARARVRAYDWLQLAFVLQAATWLPRILRATPRLLWPVRWMDGVGVGAGAALVLGAALVAAAGAATGTSPRLCRGLASIGLAMLVALDSSFGKINHHWHAWIFAGLCLAFFDERRTERGARRRLRAQRNLVVFWAAQALVLLFYTLTGLWKLVGLVVQALTGAVTYLSPSALAIQIAHASLISRSAPIAASWVASHPALSWLAVVGVLYLEVCAIVVAFRPALHTPWAVALIAFHLGVYATMALDFTPQATALALLLLRSPFAAGRSAAEAVRALPLVAPAVGLVTARLGSIRPSG